MAKVIASPAVEKLRAALSRDPKRTSLMAGLAAIMLFMWIRMLGSGPSSATASFIRRSVAAMTTAKPEPARSAGSTPVLEWLAKPKASLQRNLFLVHLDFYARARDRTLATQFQESQIDVSTDEDRQKERQILIENLQTQATRFKLQTTMMGTVPKAVINGQLVQEGDALGNFIVSRIAAQRVEIRQDGVTLEIVMP